MNKRLSAGQGKEAGTQSMGVSGNVQHLLHRQLGAIFWRGRKEAMIAGKIAPVCQMEP
jgi:hypothetical protein